MKDEPSSASEHPSVSKSVELMFTLATGALALSITFRSEVSGVGTPYLWILSSAWILLAISSLSYVLIQLFESGVSLVFYTADLKSDYKRKLIKKRKEQALKMLNSADEKITDEEIDQQLDMLKAEQISALNRLKTEINHDMDTARLFIAPIPALLKLLFVSFFLGILTLLAFGVVCNITEANQITENNTTEPNNAMEPTPVNVTVRAFARPAPFTSVAHLGR